MRHSAPVKKTRIKGSSAEATEWNEEQMACQQPELNCHFRLNEPCQNQIGKVDTRCQKMDRWTHPTARKVLTDCAGYDAGEKASTRLHDSNRNERREHSVVAIMADLLAINELFVVL